LTSLLIAVKLVEEDVVLSVVEEKEHGSKSSIHETLVIALVKLVTKLAQLGCTREKARPLHLPKPTPHGNRNILVSS